MPGVGIYFSTLHELKSKWISHTGNLSLNPLEAIILGISARSVSGICLMPFTVIKTRYEVSDICKYDYILLINSTH